MALRDSGCAGDRLAIPLLAARSSGSSRGRSRLPRAAHAGHGVNSYAISYYLVLGSVRILLHLAWGGAYMDNADAAQRIQTVFRGLRHCLPEIEQRAMRSSICAYGVPRREVDTFL